MNSEECTLRPVHYGYDPVGDNQESTPIIRPHPSHPYFERSETNDSAYLDPRSIRVPWSSTFPGCRQSKHWLAVQNAVRDFFNTIKSAERGNQDQRGNDIEPEYSTREKERMETAVSCSIYMFPEGSSKRAELISTLLLMSFIHDDAIEYSENCETVVDGILSNWPDDLLDKNALKIFKVPAFEELANEIIGEDKLLGEELLKGFIIWVQHTHSYNQIRRTDFNFGCLEDYLVYRCRDVGIEFALGMIKFGYDANVPVSHTYILSNLIHLYNLHMGLVNDLYSFDKEKRDETNGAVMINAVDVLQRSRKIPLEEAKGLTRKMIWQLEIQMHEESVSIERFGILTQDQQRLVRGLMESAAGTIFYSAVQKRYGGELAALH